MAKAKTRNSQAKLTAACRRASGHGVGFQGVVNHNRTITLRRDEEYARSTEHTYATLDEALTVLAEHEEE